MDYRQSPCEVPVIGNELENS